MDKEWPLVDRVAFAALVTLIALAAYGYAILPATIPTHFSFSGAPHSYSPKAILFLQPAIAALLWAIVALAIKQPFRLNLPFTVPAERFSLLAPMNVATQRLVRAEIVVGLAAIEWFTIESARADHLAPGLMVAVGLVASAIVATVTVFMVRVWRIARG